MGFTVELIPQADKDLKQLGKKQRKTVAKRLSILERKPWYGPHIKLLKGQAENIYRLQVGDYRIVYVIVGEKVIVRGIVHRKDVYRNL